MLTTSLIALACAATGLAQTMPSGYRAVYVTSNVDATFVVVPKDATPKAGSAIVVQKMAKTPAQQWWLQANSTQIQLSGTSLCLDAGAKSNWKDMGSLALATCATDADSQKFNVQADGRISLAKSSPLECIDLQYMRATVNNPVGLYSCAGLGNSGAKDKGINWPLVDAA